METRTKLIPGPDHPIAIAPTQGRVTVRVDDRIVANTNRALTLAEADYEPVQYIPREDVDMSLLERTDHGTYCPYKGDCSYYRIPAGGERAQNAVWTYETPYDAVSEIKDYLAFYPTRVSAIEIER